MTWMNLLSRDDGNGDYLVGPFMKYLREEMGYTQKNVSDETGFSVQTISKFENGRTGPRTFAAKKIIDTLLTLCDVRGYDAEAMYEDFVESGVQNFELQQ